MVMKTGIRIGYVLVAAALATTMRLPVSSARAAGDLTHVHTLISVMQENHSYANYCGVLGYVAGSPYHNIRGSSRKGCPLTDNTCVDGLTCKTSTKTGLLECKNR